jgi:hypothetical protein
MLKEFLWETFKRTGDIEAYLLFKEVEACDQSRDIEEVHENEMVRETLEV